MNAHDRAGLTVFVRWLERADQGQVKVHHMPSCIGDPLGPLRQRGIYAKPVGPRPYTRYVWDAGAARFDPYANNGVIDGGTLLVYSDALPDRPELSTTEEHARRRI